jgi:hypothetical protein
MATTESKIEDFAEDLGKMLGHARNKAEGWLNQRQAIVKNLTQLRDEATKLLTQLGHQVSEVPFPRGPRGRPAGGTNVVKRGPGRPAGTGIRKRRKMSAAARAKISAAQKARWAKQKAGAKK